MGQRKRMVWVVLLLLACPVFSTFPGAIAQEAPKANAEQEQPPTGEDAGVAADEAQEEELSEAIEGLVQPQEGAEDAVLEEDSKPYRVRGFFSASFRGRKRSGENDQDVYSYLSLDGGTPELDDLTFHFFGRATYDLDGDADDATDIFFSLNDYQGNQFDYHVYEAFVDLRRSLAPTFLGLEKIRLGRQDIYAGYTYLLDGLRLEFERIKSLGNLRISLYGGVPEFLYESSRRGDWLVGAELSFRPLDGTSVHLRYVHVEDRTSFNNETTQRDDFGQVTLRQRLGENVYVVGKWTLLDAATRDARFSLSWDEPDIDLSVRFSYRFQNDVEHEFTTEYDLYFAVLGPSYSYHNLDLQVSKLLDEHVGVDVGFTGRVLADDDKEAAFNREYWRAWMTLSTYDWPAKNVDLSLTGEYWDGDDDTAASVGAEITWRVSDDVKLTAGTYYSLYKYDLFVHDEREDATTIFLRGRFEVMKDVRLDGRYEFETGDEGDFHTFWMGFTLSF